MNCLLAIYSTYLLGLAASMKKTKVISQLKVVLEQGLKTNGHRKIQITCDGIGVAVYGTVRSYYEKQMVLTTIQKIGGSVEIKDNLTVV